MRIRKINVNDLRELCDEKRWYTCKNGAEHKYLMLELVRCKEELDDLDIMAIASHIRVHSDMDCIIDNVISDLDRIANISFKEI